MMTNYQDGSDGSKNRPGLKVALYLRMSDKEQRTSIDQQRRECRAYATSRGWDVVAEFIDSGKSGSKELAKRVQFFAMLEAAEKNNRQWSAILVWDTSRFGRLDSQEGAVHKLRLRRAGVWLETTRGESIDWSTSMGRVMDALKSEADAEYSQNISRNVRRGRLTMLEAGYWVSRIPYGYDRQYVEGSIVQTVIPRTKVFSKPRNWHLKPIPNGEAETVRWIFEQWRTRDMSLGGTVRELFERGVKAPGGKASWSIAQVRGLLRERAYVGDAHIGAGGKNREVLGRIGERTKQDAMPALVDRNTFAIVKKKLDQRSGAEWRPKTASGALSGIIKCQKCGHTLSRKTVREGPYTYNLYVCESATKRREHGCSQWRVHEREVLPILCRELAAAVDFDILAQMSAKKDARSMDMEPLKAEELRLRKQVAQATKNMLLVDPANFKAAQEVLGELRQEHERVANAIKLATSDATGDHRKGWLDWWEGVKGTLVEVVPPGQLVLPKSSDGSVKATKSQLMKVVGLQMKPDLLRDLFRRLNVELHLSWTRNGSRNWKVSTGILRAMFEPGQVTEKDLDAPCDISRRTTAPASSSATSRTPSSTAAPPPPTRRATRPRAARWPASPRSSRPTGSSPPRAGFPPTPRSPRSSSTSPFAPSGSPPAAALTSYSSAGRRRGRSTCSRLRRGGSTSRTRSSSSSSPSTRATTAPAASSSAGTCPPAPSSSSTPAASTSCRSPAGASTTRASREPATTRPARSSESTPSSSATRPPTA